jgi:hypothetical protein
VQIKLSEKGIKKVQKRRKLNQEKLQNDLRQLIENSEALNAVDAEEARKQKEEAEAQEELVQSQRQRNEKRKRKVSRKEAFQNDLDAAQEFWAQEIRKEKKANKYKDIFSGKAGEKGYLPDGPEDVFEWLKAHTHLPPTKNVAGPSAQQVADAADAAVNELYRRVKLVKGKKAAIKLKTKINKARGAAVKQIHANYAKRQKTLVLPAKPRPRGPVVTTQERLPEWRRQFLQQHPNLQFVSSPSGGERPRIPVYNPYQ